MVEIIDPEGFTSLRDEEINSERSAITSALAGVVSGVIKVPEGVISLGAELIDLGFDTDIAADVEQAFDKFNIFEDIADDTAIGRLAQTLVQVGVPGGIGFKLASQAVKAKKAGNYMNIKGTNLQKAAKKADDFNKTIGKRRFVAGVTGGAVGESFVADVEKIGSIGDVFEAGPTDLEEVTDEGGREDAFKKLMNRAKFGSESLLITPIVYGAGRGIKAAATRGKDLEFSNSKLDKFFNKVFSTLRARGAKPQSIFEAKMAEKGATMSDTNRAMELVKTIDSEVDSMFPTVKSVLDKSSNKRKADVYKQLNDLLFEGELSQAIPSKAATQAYKFLKDNNATDESIDKIFGAIGGARKKFVELINASSNAPKDVETLKSLMGKRVKDYLGSTYRIFEDNSVLPFMAYTPTEEAIKGAKEYFKRYAKENGKNLTDFQAQSMVDAVIKSAKNQKTPPGLPIKFTQGTLAEEGPQIDKFFKNVITDQIKPARLLAETPLKDRGHIKKLFGEIEDPRFSIHNSMTKLSGLARKNELFERIAKQDDAIKKAATATTPGGSRGFFFDDALEAAEALPNQKIVELDKFLTPYFRDEFTINPLAGKFTTESIAQGLGDTSKTFKFLFDAETDNLAVKGVNFMYRNFLLFPKAASQVAKTILSPQTHFRNLFSATAFSAANGVLFENPALVGRAFRDAFGKLQVGRRSAEANEAYRELLELGVVNSQVQLGDIKNLLSDVRMGENLNIAKPLESMSKKLMSGTVRKAKGFMKVAEDLYTAEDDLFKIANYAVEMQRLRGAYTKVGKKFTERQLKEEAADIVRNTVPNYAYVSDTVRALRRLPLGTFMSFPSEILRTTTNIAKRSIKEIQDPALRSIGLKRLAGMVGVVGAAPYGFQKIFQGIYNITNEELRALKQFLPEWSKNSTILPVRDEETGELKYIDFSHGNAYDTAIRPLQTLLNNIQQGITDDKVLMQGVMKGMAEAAGELASPFISEAIFTEAMVDLLPILGRGGKTIEGRQIYTEAQFDNEPGTAIKNMIEHLGASLLPFSYPQLTRIYQAAADKPSDRGEFFELPDELTGFFGFRQVKIDPVRSMGFKISGYQRGTREARALFTGGSESLLKGGPKTGRDVIERFIVANRAKFNNDKQMRANIQAAETLGTDMNLIRREFGDRQLSTVYNQLNRDIFVPYFPSNNIRKEFREIEQRIGVDNPFEEVKDILVEIRNDVKQLSFDDEFEINIEDYLPSDDMTQYTLPTTPGVDPTMIQPAVQQASLTQTGLTPSEQALLSPEEQAIRLRQRGMA